MSTGRSDSRTTRSATLPKKGNNTVDSPVVAGYAYLHGDPFAQICDAIGLSGNSLVALELGFYGDAGGNKDKSNVAFGGYIATVEQWKAFKKPWDDEREKQGVEYFHRSEMEPPFYGEFAGKGWTKQYQVPVLKRLHGIIKRSTIRGIGHAVKNSAFAQLMPPQIKRMYGGAYGWCVLLELVEVGLWARRRDQWVHYFFEAGDEGQGAISQVICGLYNNPAYRELFRINSWTFAPKRGHGAIIQFQPADFIAFEAYKDIHNFLAGSPREARQSRKDLIRPKRDELRLWADEALSKWLVRLADFNGDVIQALITDDPNS